MQPTSPHSRWPRSASGVITPAISVLSATEGLAVATPAFAPWVVPATLVLLFLLFSVQKYGSGRVGAAAVRSGWRGAWSCAPRFYSSRC